MPLRPDPSRAGAVLARLDGLRAAVTAGEDDVLACLVVTGEPRPQRVLDDWLDQVADTLRALGETAADLGPVVGRYAVPAPDADRAAPTEADLHRTGCRPGGPLDPGLVVSVVPGDPASLSACARTVREVARRLDDHATGVRAAYREVGDGWTGRESVATRRAGAGLADATSATTAELDRVGRVLQDHATDLADLVARARAIEERAAEAGLEVRDGRVERALGRHRTGGRRRRPGAGRRPRRRCRPTSTSSSPSTPAAATGCSRCCAARRARSARSPTGCGRGERIAGPTSERTRECD